MAKQQRLFDLEPPPWSLDEEEDRLVAEVVLSEPPFGPFDYLIPESHRAQVSVGCRLRVPLGRSNRKVVGYCVRVYNRSERPDAVRRRLKEIHSLIDARPLLSPSMMSLTEWMANYYLCPWGQVLDGVVPAGVRGKAGTREVVYLSVPTSVAARITQLKLPKKQAHALKCLNASVDPLTIPQLCARAECTVGPVRALQTKGLVQSVTRRVHQYDHSIDPIQRTQPPTLNEHQDAAVTAILTALQEQRPETFLLFGVTGSGKTEVYMRAIEEVVSYGRQAIVLVPEISLTPQTVTRFRSRFERVAVLHSHLSPSERHWHWEQIAAGAVSVVVGARSAVFAPTLQLGLIVLDEEHDGSFKQDSAPRYHARDVALQRAARDQIPVVLGSATPSLDSWREMQMGRFSLIELPERVMSRPLPDVGVIDMRTEHGSRGRRGAISRPMYHAMRSSLDEGGQVILLLNRRGYSTFIQCPACGSVVRCPDCDISLTHHREKETVICHYCEYETQAPARCPDCNFEGIRYGGLGTQRLEAEVRARFADNTCLRMDSDTMQKAGSHELALDRFRAGEVQILLGTQMIAKGLDFPNVTLVGVVNADTALHFPDYRAAERTFQLVTQVAGRTGRGPLGGRVLVQTYSPEHPAIQSAMRHDYREFSARELEERDSLGFPPAMRMVRLILRGPHEAAVEAASEKLSERLLAALPADDDQIRTLGPAPAPLAKLRGKFRFHLVALGPDGGCLRAAVLKATQDFKVPDEIQWVVDVDPWDML